VGLNIGCLLILLSLATAWGQGGPPDPGGSSGRQLEWWPFADTNWLSYSGDAPVVSSNLVNIPGGGDGACLLLDTTNTSPAFLLYNLIETNGQPSLSLSNGTISLWLNPSWTSTNLSGGAGPGDWADLITVGAFGTNSGFWSLYFDASGSSIFFSSGTNGGAQGTWLSGNISLSASTWYNLVLTYGPTNSALYLNGELLTNGTGVPYLPGPSASVWAAGSDTNGYSQFRGRLDDLVTYDYQQDPYTIAGNFEFLSLAYYGSPVIVPFLTNAPPSPSGSPAPEWFTGPGIVQDLGASGLSCATNAQVWLTNTTALLANDGATTLKFSIAGGSSNLIYDIYGCAALTGNAAATQWYWLGQGHPCERYRLNLSDHSALIILGKSWVDNDGDGLPDAFETLVSKTSATTNATYNGLPDAWVALNGLVGNTALGAQDPDFDGLSNAQEYLFGTKPLVNEGWTIWTGAP